MSPRSKEQFEEIREKSRQKILQAALEIFAQHGYASSSVDQIARKSDMAKGSVYHYFGSKEAIFEAVVKEGLAEFEQIFEALNHQDTPQDRLATLIEVSFASIVDKKEFWRLYFSLLTQLNLPKSLHQLLGPLLEEMFGFMTHLFEEMGRRNPAVEAKILAATLDGVFLHYLMLGEDYPLVNVKESILKQFTRS